MAIYKLHVTNRGNVKSRGHQSFAAKKDGMERSLETLSHITSPPPAELDALRRAFLTDGFVELQHCFAAPLIDRIRTAVGTALDNGRRVNLRMPATGNSLRSYVLAGRGPLLAADPFINELYRSDPLTRLLSHVTGVSIQPVPYLPEEFVATRYETAGDTHGWHWDDYAYALIWVLEAPAPGEGGTLEFIQNVPWDKQNPQIDHYTATREIHARHPHRGTIYLLRTDTTLHRVTELTRDVRREMLCLSYADPADFTRTITHETIETLAYAN